MKKTLLFLHIIGGIMFFGSILMFLVVTLVADRSSLEALVFAREAIKVSVLSLTLPGLALALISGFRLAQVSGRLGERWIKAEAILAGIIVLNAGFMLVPSVFNLVDAAKASLAAGQRLAEYSRGYLWESIAGGINMTLILSCIIVEVRNWNKA